VQKLLDANIGETYLKYLSVCLPPQPYAQPRDTQTPAFTSMPRNLIAGDPGLQKLKVSKAAKIRNQSSTIWIDVRGGRCYLGGWIAYAHQSVNPVIPGSETGLTSCREIKCKFGNVCCSVAKSSRRGGHHIYTNFAYKSSHCPSDRRATCNLNNTSLRIDVYKLRARCTNPGFQPRVFNESKPHVPSLPQQGSLGYGPLINSELPPDRPNPR
jgi:hypothetical protein